MMTLFLRKIKFVFTLVIISLQIGFSQTENEKQFREDSLRIVKKKMIKPQFKFDNRISFYGNQALETSGFDAGVLLSEKLRVTLGYYSVKKDIRDLSFTREGEDFTMQYQLNYGSLNTELIYKNWRFFSLGMPLEVAAGLNELKEKRVMNGEILSTRKGGLIFANFGVSGTFKPMRFLGLKGILGYRKMIYNQVQDFNFDGFFTSIGLNVDINEIVTDIKMFRLRKKYNKGNSVTNVVDLITD